RHSQGSVCVSNLSQVGKAIGLYASDYDDHLPFAPSCTTAKQLAIGKSVYGDPIDKIAKNLPDIRTALHPYGVVPLLFRCPLDRISEVIASEGGHRPTFFEEEGSSYSYDDQDALVKSVTFSGFEHPSQKMLSWDIYDGFHDGNRNTLFADLHVKIVTPSQQVKAVEEQ
ncbi:MAG: hypothetical protein JWN14_339, partial [Chthonomonadales bacterium]|nr:hypothetical protein [Chthonomonadales bacterium]